MGSISNSPDEAGAGECGRDLTTLGTPGIDGTGIGIPGTHEGPMSGGMTCTPTGEGEGVDWDDFDASAIIRDSSSALASCSSSSTSDSSWLRPVASDADTANARAKVLILFRFGRFGSLTHWRFSYIAHRP